MIKKLVKNMTRGYDLSANPFLYRRLSMTVALLSITLFAFVVFSFINFVGGNYFLVLLDTCVILLSLFSLYLLLIKKKIELASMVATVFLLVFLLLFSFLNKNNGFGLVWTLCYPLFVVPILGTKNGLRMIGLFYLILIPLAYNGIGVWDYGNWDNTSFLRFLLASFTIVFIAYFFESTTVKAYQTIMKIRDKEKRYLEELENLSVTDQLTGLHNRRYFDEHFTLEQMKVVRYGNPLCLMMIDIDHFKNVNDKYGHQVGDTVLKEFANLLQKRVRSSDILSRWGGEEFIILLPATDMKSCEVIAEDLRIAVQEFNFTSIKNLTTSIGISQVNAKDSNQRKAIHNADTALYQAKENGRNRIEKL
jgi:diguanylate cyclase (GGDEF)-like protein